MNKFIAQNKERLENFTGLSRTAGARNDYVQGGGGNTSVKLDETLMAIKASGYCLADIKPDSAYAVLDYSLLRNFYYSSEPSSFEDVEKSGSEKTKEAVRKIEGVEPLRPSVEAGFHSILDRYVLHTHSVYANLAACSKECTQIVKEALEETDYTWGYVGYTDPGARLTFSIKDEIERVKANTNTAPPILFMGNHGLIVHHQDHGECLRIHDDVNARTAKMFGMTGHDFPGVNVREDTDGTWVSEAPYLEEHLRSGRYGIAELVEDALYPDQIVFLKGTFFIGAGAKRPEADTCQCDIHTGKIVFNMRREKAQTIAETLTAVIFIRENISKRGYTLMTMGDSAKAFIASWESEKYRKSLAGKKK